jgi:hypothetical protein
MAPEAIWSIKEIWDGFDQELIDNLVRSFPNRVKMVLDAEGRTIQLLISAGKTAVSPGYACVHPLVQ